MTAATPLEAVPIPHQPRAVSAAVVPQDLSVQQVVQHVTKVREIISKLFIPGVHYGVVPGTDNRRCPNCSKYRTLHDTRDGVVCVQGPGKDGCGTVFAPDDARVWVKKSLYQPGVDTLCLAFKLAPEYRIVEQVREVDPPHHVSYLIECVIRHAASGAVLGSALGSASTRESKWGQIAAQRKCPTCQQPAIKVSSYRDEAGNFYCYDKLGGCGAKFDRGDVRITKQPTGKTWREEMGDVANTVLKMAVKRAKVAAVLTVTAASDAFEQDLEDLQAMAGEAGGEGTDGADATPQPPPPPSKSSSAAKPAGPAAGAPTARVDTGKKGTTRAAKAQDAGSQAAPAAAAPDKSPVERLVASYAELGVTAQQLEHMLQHPIGETSGTEFDQLRALYQRIKAGTVKVETAFPPRDDMPKGEEIPMDPPQRRDDGS